MCSHCTRLGQQCTYSVTTRNPPSRPRGRGVCFSKFGVGSLDHSLSTSMLQNSASVAVEYFFQQFLPTNSFSGLSSTYMYDVHLYSQSCPQVYHAVAAVGALSIRRCSGTKNPNWSRLAFESYERSLKALHSHLQAADSTGDQLQSLWSILLLGVFELMQDRTGQGFLQHLNLGVAQVVEYLGPQAFRQGQARRFFLEMQLLEVNKSILLSQPSLLARTAWRELTEHSSQDGTAEACHVLETLPDIMACSSDFVVR